MTSYSWLLCLLFTIILIIKAFAVVLDKTYGKLRMGKTFIYMLVAAYIIYLPILDVNYSLIGIIVGDLMNVMQIISLDAGYLDSYEIVLQNIWPSWLIHGYLFVLGVIHFFVPITAATTAYTFISHCMAILKIRFINVRGKNIYVLSAMNEQAINLVLDIAEKEKRKTTFIFTDAQAHQGEHDDLLEKINYILFEENICNLQFKAKKAEGIYFFLLDDSDDKNMDEALVLIEKYSTEEKDIQKKIFITLFSKSGEAENMIDSTEKGVINIRIVNSAQTVCYELLDKYPLYLGKRGNLISILIVGFDDIGQEAAKAAVWIGQLEGVKLKIRIMDKDITNKKRRFEFICPEITEKEYDISYIETNFDDKGFGDVLESYSKDASYIIVSGKEDDENIRTAIYLRRFYLRKDTDFKNKPFIAVRVSSTSKHATIKALKTPETKVERKVSYELIPFGSDESIFTFDELIRSPLVQLAKNVHLAYEEIFSGEDIQDITKALERFNAFEVNKHSNLANALHIRYKLHMLGLNYVEEGGGRESVGLDEHLNDAYMKQLASAEHDRWMAFLRSEGWTTASLDQVNGYKNAELSKGRHNCPLLKMHPYICPNDDLPAISEKLELIDATIYDVELIKRIPEILGNKWGAADKCYKIVVEGK